MSPLPSPRAGCFPVVLREPLGAACSGTVPCATKEASTVAEYGRPPSLADISWRRGSSSHPQAWDSLVAHQSDAAPGMSCLPRQGHKEPTATARAMLKSRSWSLAWRKPAPWNQADDLALRAASDSRHVEDGAAPSTPGRWSPDQQAPQLRDKPPAQPFPNVRPVKS